MNTVCEDIEKKRERRKLPLTISLFRCDYSHSHKNNKNFFLNNPNQQREMQGIK